MTRLVALGRRALREVMRQPEATVPTVFIPLFFLLVNIGQVSSTFTPETPFLLGQRYVAFQLPISLLFAVSSVASGLALVTDIDNGYFNKLLVAPVGRTTIVLGRLAADFVRGLVVATLVLLAGLALGARVESGILGAALIVVLMTAWGVAYAGIAMTIALRTRSVQATSTSFILFFPLLFLTPNFVPFDRLSPIMEALARVNPVSYVITGTRSLILEGFVVQDLVICALVILSMGALLISLTVRSALTYET